MRLRKAGALLALALAAVAAAGCTASAGGDKAGGPAGGPVVLRMASTPWSVSDAPPVADFVRRVRALSGGSVQITVINQWGEYAPGAEAQVAGAVGADADRQLPAGKRRPQVRHAGADAGRAGQRARDRPGGPG